MALKKIVSQFNISAQCRRYGLPLWQCPQFLFTLMGLFIIGFSIFSYLVGSRYITDPEVVALAVLVVTAILFVISFFVTRNFERLSEISRMKSEFINIVTHQLRSPLTNLKWVSEFLTSSKNDVSKDQVKEYYGNLKENIDRMVELVDNLLIVSRLEQGKTPSRKKETSLEDLTRELISQFNSFAEARHIKISFFAEKNLPLVFADPSFIKLVLENLLDNAIKYTKGGGSIEIWLVRNKNRIRFEIKDQGVGIPENDQKYIFQKFFRSENALREQTRGSGLGLYITKSIVEKEGGKIWFESKEGKGTTFYFILPIK